MHRGRKICLFILFAAYCGLVVHLLLLRTPGSYTGSALRSHVNLVPGNTIRLFARLLHKDSGSKYTLAAFTNLFGNVVLFIPLGYFLPAIFARLGTFFRTALLSALLISALELTQLLTKVGSCDIDDLILNLLGCCIGYAVFALWRGSKNVIL